MTCPAGRYPVVLLVGGTDPSGGAGLAADLKTAAACGVHGVFAVTAVTVQNSGGVRGWTTIPEASVLDQLETVMEDGAVGAVKTGMLGSPGMASMVSGFLGSLPAGLPYVLDPVLAAGSGDTLHEGDMACALSRLLVPASTLCTPNLDEAEALTGMQVRDRSAMEAAGAEIVRMGARAALVKGGHLEGPPADVLVTAGGTTWFEGRRTWPGKLHGTGCTLASAIAARLASGHGLEEAVASGLAYLRQAAGSCFSRRRGALLGHLPPAGPRRPSPDGTAFYMPPRHCAACGEALVAPEGTTGHMHCLRCGAVTWRNPLPAVSVVAVSGDRVLLVRRAVAPGRGLYCLPGGFLELGETVEECARRELAEETGLSAGTLELLRVETDMTEYGGVVLSVMLAGDLSGTPVPGDDASETGWFPAADPPDLAFAAHGRILEDLSCRLS